MEPWDLGYDRSYKKTRVSGLPDGENYVIVRSLVLS